jgi:hypothetical protein
MNVVGAHVAVEELRLAHHTEVRAKAQHAHDEERERKDELEGDLHGRDLPDLARIHQQHSQV